MTNAIRSEFLKFFSTRLWWGMAIALVVSTALFTGLFAFFSAGGQPAGGDFQLPGLDNPQMVSTVYSSGLLPAQAMMIAIGVLSIGGEYRHKTITGTFLATPRRSKVMAAKVISLLGIGAFYGLIMVVTSFAVGASVIASKGFPILPEGALRTLLLMLLALGLWGLIGLGLGILIPNQIAAVLIGVGFVFVVGPILSAIFAAQDWGRAIAPYFPDAATSAIVNSITIPGGVQYLSVLGGTLVLIVYAAVLTIFGTWRTSRADIS